MTPPVIGITVSQNFENHRPYNQNPSAYSEAIAMAGGLPLLIPNEFPLEQINNLLAQIDGLLISGGGDIDPRIYGGEEHPTIAGICKARDRLEMELLKTALKVKKSVLGICRGMQLINVALGGTLYTHIPAQFNTALIHNSAEEEGRDKLVHDVELELNSKLGRIVGLQRFAVNSFHHQAVQNPAPDLMVTARATDGLIEAVESAGIPFGVIGVQWHPECLLTLPSQLAIFKSFIDASQN